MHRRSLGAATAAALTTLALAAPASADSRDPINAYRVKATGKTLAALASSGFDVTEGRRKGGVIEVYGTTGQLRKARGAGVKARLVKDRRGRTAAQRSALAARKGSARARAANADRSRYTGSDAGYAVWRRYDAVAGDGKEQYEELYDRVAKLGIAKKVSLTPTRKTHLGRDIWAIKLTRGAKTTRDGARPAVLYNAQQHAREWLAGETCRRSLLYFVDNYGKDPQVTRLVDTRELWFSCISNPDGYEYTFTPGNRLWRKNMADNDRDGIHGEQGDGVDPNRNFPVNWGLDDEGSSPETASETYRGPEPYAPEPETQAMLDLWNRIDFAFQKNDHTAAKLILYPQGWQQYTKAADHPIFTALAGDDEDPAIATFDPDLGAELYITNGDTLDTAYNEEEILAYTPEGSEPADTTVSGFEFEDKEAAIEAEFRRHKPFVLDLAESADKPDQPDSHLGNTVQDFYVDSFPTSYGTPQPVQVTAKRALGAVVMRYRINGGAAKSTSTAEVTGEERYNTERGAYYHHLRGTVLGAAPGDSVEVWFETKPTKAAPAVKASKAFTYEVKSDSGSRALVLAAEDYSGPTPAQTGPSYLDRYVDALKANGISPDVYDVDAMGRTAPHPLGVLSHYDVVVWYTGKDYLTREPGQVPGTGTSRLALEEMTSVRDYLNEGGKLIYAGQHAGQQYTEGFEFRNEGFAQPDESQQGRWCDADLPEARDGCIAHTDDFLQYYLGAYIRAESGNAFDRATDTVTPVSWTDPLRPATWTFEPQAEDPGAGDPTAAFAVTSSIIDRPAYQDSERLAKWDRAGAGPFSPHTGAYYMAADRADEAYQRVHTTVDLTGKSASKLSFQASFDTEPAWDFLFVEAREVGTENWTTLPATGKDGTARTSTATGDSCWEDGGWGSELHSRLLHYQTLGRDTCSPTGTTGEWHAMSGNSNGWQDWNVDLGSRYAGKEVEVAIVYATDWAIQNLGVWLDQVEITADGAVVAATSFEDGAGEDPPAPFEVGGGPASSPNQDARFRRSPEQFTEGAVVGTTDTVYAGFEVGTIAGADGRRTFVREALRHLGILG